MRRVRPAHERFFEKVLKTEGCWLWTAYRSPLGYGRFAPTASGPVSAHRWSYEFAYGPIPDGLHIDHLCRVTSCVRPDHLEAVTNSENVRRQARALGRNRGPRRTTCRQGHELAGENLAVYIGKKVQYICRTCQRERGARRSVDNSRALAVQDPCGYVSERGHACRRGRGHEGRHHGVAPQADAMRDTWHALARAMTRRSAA